MRLGRQRRPSLLLLIVELLVREAGVGGKHGRREQGEHPDQGTLDEVHGVREHRQERVQKEASEGRRLRQGGQAVRIRVQLSVGLGYDPSYRAVHVPWIAKVNVPDVIVAGPSSATVAGSTAAAKWRDAIGLTTTAGAAKLWRDVRIGSTAAAKRLSWLPRLLTPVVALLSSCPRSLRPPTAALW
eukprot:1180396-Prorocentrum_minimum.AAC.4